MNRKAEDIKKIVRDGYARAVSQNVSCCSANSCCAGIDQAKDISKKVGYSDSEMNAVPEGAFFLDLKFNDIPNTMINATR